MNAADPVELSVEGGPAPLRHTLRVGERVVLGRGRSAGLLLLDEQASREHAVIELTPAGLQVTDLGGANGTTLDGARLPPNQPVAAARGAVLGIGSHLIRLGGGRLQDDYEQLGELGRGGHAVVYAARRRSDGREVAIKAMHTQGHDAVARARFLREATVQVQAPQVVSILEVRSEGERAYIVMEFVRGRSLQAALADGPLPIVEAVRIAREVAAALAAAHEQGLVHRDVKPANVLLGDDGAVKLADFGIAKERGSVLTATGQGIGSLDYLPPEQAEDAKRVSPAADLYALGATLYHMLAGRPPFDARQPDFFEQLFEEDPPRLQRLRPDCPAGLASLVHRLLEKEPQDRVRDARALIAQLERLGA